MHRWLATGVALWATVMAPGQASAAASIKCTMKFTMKAWSAFYKTSDGTGAITCDNGRSLKVSLSARGGGLTVGKSAIEDGYGQFSAIESLEELYGAYVAAEQRADAVKSSGAQLMTKGAVSLALSRSGDGVDLGVAWGALTIAP